MTASTEGDGPWVSIWKDDRDPRLPWRVTARYFSDGAIVAVHTYHRLTEGEATDLKDRIEKGERPTH